MDLSLTEDQRMLRSMAREFLESECPTTLVRAMEHDEIGYPKDLWRKMAELGWMGLALPAEHGGAGMSLLDLSVLLEELGRFLVPGPYVPSVVLAGTAISEFGSSAQKAEWLPGIADGSAVLTYAHAEPNGMWDLDGVEAVAESRGDSYVLNGTKAHVPFAHAAHSILVPAKLDQEIIVLVVDRSAAGLRHQEVWTIGGDRVSTVQLTDVSVPQSSTLGGRSVGRDIVERLNRLGAAAKCAEMVGGAQRVLEMSIQFAQERKAFGKPIGAFQAIQHHCANMVTEVDGARLVTSEAFWSLADGAGGALEASVAKACVSDACRRVMFLGHQIHGAIGFTWEHDLQLFTRRAKSAELAFGDGEYHRERVAQSLGL